jgi:hypothetical protein
MDADERLRREVASDLLHAVSYVLSLHSDPVELANSRIVRTIADLEIERRRLSAEQPKATAPSLFRPRFRKLNC